MYKITSEKKLVRLWKILLALNHLLHNNSSAMSYLIIRIYFIKLVFWIESPIHTFLINKCYIEPCNQMFFYIGGPGSGKVTHCDNLMIEKRGIVHINMTDLLQQYTVGNGKLFVK